MGFGNLVQKFDEHNEF